MVTKPAGNSDIRPLRIALLNLMPTKVATENDFSRLLSNFSVPVEIHLMKMKSHVSKNTPLEHMQKFYRDFEQMKTEKFDGMIITGAPVEHLRFEDVDYWHELTEVFDWCRTNIPSTLYICWASQAALYYYYGIPKYPLPEKMFGIFPQTPADSSLPIFSGFDGTFNMPHSRHTEIRRMDIGKVPQLQIIAESPISGVSMVMARDGREIYITGHMEYSPLTLDSEYKRDIGKGLPIHMPYNYYVDDEPTKDVNFSWHSHARQLFNNWLRYYVNL